MKRREIAIFGYGRFGRLAAEYLKREFRVSVVDPRRSLRLAPGLKRVSLRDAATIPIIILAVPIRRMQSVLQKLAPLVRPGTLICDVCSVKEQPALWMKELLPNHVSLLGTHPLFGPDSAHDGLEGHSMVLCPIRISKQLMARIESSLSLRFMNVHVMTPRRHDRIIASTLFLTHFVGRGLSDILLPSIQTSTANYLHLTRIISTARSDSYELFEDMFRFNRFARVIPDRIVKSILKTSRRLKGHIPG